ncbi:unnamed protein product [Pedinophyceae sp. YPF-701]|nr:unnamed protein product [Pedinophyceae sp. YPF-701]
MDGRGGLNYGPRGGLMAGAGMGRGAAPGAGGGAGFGDSLPFAGVLQRLDAFPKIRDEEFYKRTLAGGVITIVAAAIMTLLFLSEAAIFLRVHKSHELTVDTTRNEKIDITVDITLPRLPCAWLSVDAMDVSGESHLDVEEEIFKKRLDAQGNTIQVTASKVGPEVTTQDYAKKKAAGNNRRRLQGIESSMMKGRDDGSEPAQLGGAQGGSGEPQDGAGASQLIDTAGDSEGKMMPQDAPNQAPGGVKLRPGDEGYCGDCYGAATHCCNSCDEVREAYRRMGWALPDLMTIEQCHDDKHMQDIQEQRGEGCHVFGTLRVNKVAGNIHIAPGRSYQAGPLHVHDLSPFGNDPTFDLSHTFHKLSFGADYPGKPPDPLDGLTKDSRKKGSMPEELGMHQYFLKVVPTVYKGASGKVVRSNQLSITEHFKPSVQEGLDARTLPGIFMFYDLSPIKVEVVEERASFLHFLTNVCAIVGGVFTVAGILEATVYHAARIRKKIELGKFS